MYIIIVGCGRVGSELARLLTNARHNVVVIDKNQKSFQSLGSDFNGVTLAGDGFDVDLLKEAGIEHADAFCAVTDNDNANVMSGQVAKKIFHIPKVITRINDAQYAGIYRELGIETVSSTKLLASTIKNKIIESTFSSFLLENDTVNVMEIEANEKNIGKKISDLNLPGELSIAVLVKKDKGATFPLGSESVEEGDVLIGIVKTESLGKAKKTLGLK
ncbi:MAG: TrkA family potassium uptake protein [Candidatus Omnitrophica bacterium]|nr:TrkA family potassium uptake protein [Candidatus Omnitrophota bacterium]